MDKPGIGEGCKRQLLVYESPFQRIDSIELANETAQFLYKAFERGMFNKIFYFDNKGEWVHSPVNKENIYDYFSRIIEDAMSGNLPTQYSVGMTAVFDGKKLNPDVSEDNAVEFAKKGEHEYFMVYHSPSIYINSPLEAMREAGFLRKSVKLKMLNTILIKFGLDRGIKNLTAQNVHKTINAMYKYAKKPDQDPVWPLEYALGMSAGFDGKNVNTRISEDYIEQVYYIERMNPENWICVESDIRDHMADKVECGTLTPEQKAEYESILNA